MSENNLTDMANTNDTQQFEADKPSTEKARVPAQFFQWFDNLRQGYENSINKLFNRVEKVNQDHKEQIKDVYQSQIDGLKKSYQDHLQSLKSTNQSQIEQAQARIKQLEKDAQFYQDQIKTQNQTIDKLNGRYDAVIFALKDKMDNKELENVIKDISPSNEHHVQPTLNDTALPQESSETTSEQQNQQPTTQAAQQATSEATTEQQSNAQDIEQIMNQAFSARQQKQYEQAYELFYTAAIEGNGKAMGAIGRAHFVGEGISQDKTLGLAWLIKAAEHQFEPAIKKVSGAEQKSPELYQSAIELAKELF